VCVEKSPGAEDDQGDNIGAWKTTCCVSSGEKFVASGAAVIVHSAGS